MLTGSGDVGIGTGAPTEKLHINGNSRIDGQWKVYGSNGTNLQGIMRGTDSNNYFGLQDRNANWIVRSTVDTQTDLFVAGTRVLRAKADGTVGIGAVSYTGSYKLFVEDGILTERVKIATIGSADWADYVFEDDYELRSLDEIKNFVQKNKHLPNIPSAKSVEKNGYELQQMDAKLLEKIEELYLHSIQLEENNGELKDKLQGVEQENFLLKTELQKLIKRIEKLEQ